MSNLETALHVWVIAILLFPVLDRGHCVGGDVQMECQEEEEERGKNKYARIHNVCGEEVKSADGNAFGSNHLEDCGAHLNGHEGAQGERVRDCQKEEFVVGISDTIVQPRTMMIHS